MKNFIALAALSCALLSACGLVEEGMLRDDSSAHWSFGQELSFFNKYEVPTVILSDGDSIVALSPAWQGRVLTSTFGGVEAPALGWINRRLIADKTLDAQKAVIGGEDSFAIGPQGGDESVFFDRGKVYTEDNWIAPAWISSQPWNVVARTQTQVKFEKSAEFENAKGAQFKIKAEREVSLLTRKNVTEILGIEIPDAVKIVAFQSLNKLTNAGDKPWTAADGLLNVSVRGCFNAVKDSFVFVPYRKGNVSDLGDVYKDDYFEPAIGPSGSARTVLVTEDYIRFRADGRTLSGISVPAPRSEGIAISYDDVNKVLTVVTYLRPVGNRAYLISSWRRTPAPNEMGEAISVFNNGPLSLTSASAPKYFEISTHSPAMDLKAGRAQFHLQRTFHFHGSEYDLGLISYKLAGISIGQLRGESE